MFWGIFVHSAILMLGILAVGWFIAYLIDRRDRIEINEQ